MSPVVAVCLKMFMAAKMDAEPRTQISGELDPRKQTKKAFINYFLHCYRMKWR